MRFHTLRDWIFHHFEISPRLRQVCLWYLLSLMVETRKHSLEFAAVLSGLNATVTVAVERMPQVGGMDLVLCFDPTMQFFGAEPLGAVADWEYFTFRMSEEDTCGGNCPRGQIRLIGIADMPDGKDPDPGVYLPEGPIVKLIFGTPADLDHICDCFDLRWCWFDCGDNAFSSPQGESLYVAYNVDAMLPKGKCLETDKPIIPSVRFMNGKICILPPPDGPGGENHGDCNADGSIDLADIVYWLDYVFHGGPEPLGDHFCSGPCRADFNCDDRVNAVDIAAMVKFVLHQPMPHPCAPKCP